MTIVPIIVKTKRNLCSSITTAISASSIISWLSLLQNHSKASETKIEIQAALTHPLPSPTAPQTTFEVIETPPPLPSHPLLPVSVSPPPPFPAAEVSAPPPLQSNPLLHVPRPPPFPAAAVSAPPPLQSNPSQTTLEIIETPPPLPSHSLFRVSGVASTTTTTATQLFSPCLFSATTIISGGCCVSSSITTAISASSPFI